jgi:hypothetical protein
MIGIFISTEYGPIHLLSAQIILAVGVLSGLTQHIVWYVMARKVRIWNTFKCLAEKDLIVLYMNGEMIPGDMSETD